MSIHAQPASARLPHIAALAAPLCLSLHAADIPEIAAVTDAMRRFVAQQEVAGAVTVVAAPDRILHLGAVGHADVAAGRPARPDTLYWIASMTKPVTATAVLMLQDEGKLSVGDPVAKYIPEFAATKSRDGKPAQLTLQDLLTHTSGLAEATPQEAAAALTLSDLIPAFTSKPLQFEPRTKWQYCQSGINTLGRIVEVVSGQPLPDFFKARLFDPLGMKDTTFYPSAEQLARIAKPYKRENGALKETAFWHGVDPSQHDHFPAANGGLFSTAPDYARFCQMLLNRGTLDGRRYLKPESVALMTRVHSGTLKTGFTDGNGWGLGVCVVREPQGVTAALSPGSYGHGGAFGTQAWIDPVRQRAYILMVQRADFPNSDASDVRRAFQGAAAAKTFIDYFLPLPVTGALSKDVWGAPEVGARDAQNGLEDVTVKQWYYWDGQLLRTPDGTYHLYASRWDQARGHNGWFGSKAVHAVSDALCGPYVDKGLCWPDNEGGKGHNVTALTLPDGRYAVVISETRPGAVFVSKSPDGPWEPLGLIQVATNEYTKLGRMSNASVMLRPDGDFEIVPRSGAILISKSGVLGPYVVQGPSIYPKIDGLPQTDLRNFEDPVVWFSGGYYHIVVNNWSQRKAYHLTSKDGINGWTFRGLAYDPTRDFVRYADGTVNRWHKLERPGVLVENGHVVAVTLAVLDVPKDQQKGNDAHGSKVIVLPFDGAALDRDLQAADAAGVRAP